VPTEGEQVFEEPRLPLWGAIWKFGIAYCMLTVTTRQGVIMVSNPNNFGDVAKLASELITAIHDTTRTGDSISQTLPDGLRVLLNSQGSLVADLVKLAEWCDDIYYANVIASTK
jgi:hypothetical protein